MPEWSEDERRRIERTYGVICFADPQRIPRGVQSTEYIWDAKTNRLVLRVRKVWTGGRRGKRREK